MRKSASIERIKALHELKLISKVIVKRDSEHLLKKLAIKKSSV